MARAAPAAAARPEGRNFGGNHGARKAAHERRGDWGAGRSERAARSERGAGRGERGAGRGHARAARGRRAPRRASGRAGVHLSGAAARLSSGFALPLRLLNGSFARSLRARTARLLDALLSGRGWIALIGVLLTGIVFFNVDLLQMNRDIARDAEKASALRRENARLHRDVARLASSERIQEAAARLGLVLPAPGEVRYLKARPEMDARRAAKRITAPDGTFIPPAPTATAPDQALPPAATTMGGTTTTAPSGTGAPATTTPPAGTATPPDTTGAPPAATTPPAGTAAPPGTAAAPPAATSAPTGAATTTPSTGTPTTTAPPGTSPGVAPAAPPTSSGQTTTGLPAP
jgi:cell division protein FtsL